METKDWYPSSTDAFADIDEIGHDDSDPRCSANFLDVIRWPESPTDARLDAVTFLGFASVSHRALFVLTNVLNAFQSRVSVNQFTTSSVPVHLKKMIATAKPSVLRRINHDS